jgi:hypothetical protein
MTWHGTHLANNCVRRWRYGLKTAGTMPIVKQVKFSLSTPCRWSRGIHPLILNPGTRGKSVVNFTSRLLYPWKRTPVSVLFWDITQCMVVILYRRFRTTYWPHLQGSRSVTTQRCVISQKRADLIYIAEEAWDHSNRGTHWMVCWVETRAGV